MRGECAVESNDAASGQALTQVIVGSAVAETKLDYGSLYLRDFRRYVIEDIPLGGDPADETVETAHMRRNLTV